MPVLSAKTQSSGFEALAAKVEAKKKEEREKEIANEALKTFSVKSIDRKDEPTDTGATTIQNLIGKKKFNSNNNETNLDFKVSLQANTTEDRQKHVQTEATTNNEINKNEADRRSERSYSIVSGSQKIQELQEIQKQLNKSYEPKPLFEPRRPTLESIKSAIEKAKQDEESRNKSVGTENDDVTIVTTSDASTSVEKFFKKKKHKKKKTPDITSANSAGTSSVTNKNKKRSVQNKPAVQNKKKVNVGVKIKAKINTSNSNESVDKSTN